MARRARALLAQYPDAERSSVYLEFRFGWYRGKGRQMDAKIAEMAREGWTFLRATEVTPLRTIRSWGGGLHLHFIRVYSDELQSTHVASLDPTGVGAVSSAARFTSRVAGGSVLFSSARKCVPLGL